MFAVYDQLSVVRSVFAHAVNEHWEDFVHDTFEKYLGCTSFCQVGLQ
jgi:hypothetical protein